MNVYTEAEKLVPGLMYWDISMAVLESVRSRTPESWGPLPSFHNIDRLSTLIQMERHQLESAQGARKSYPQTEIVQLMERAVRLHELRIRAMEQAWAARKLATKHNWVSTYDPRPQIMAELVKQAQEFEADPWRYALIRWEKRYLWLLAVLGLPDPSDMQFRDSRPWYQRSEALKSVDVCAL